MPYFAVAWGAAPNTVVRVSSRVLSESTAMQECYGLVDHQRMTTKAYPKSPRSMTQKEKKQFNDELLAEHKKKEEVEDG